MKILLKAITLAVMLSAFGCARTETERINAEINYLRGLFDKHEKNEFDRLPLIPVWLKELKREKWIPNRIRELEKRLKGYEAVILRKIHIDSGGSWDSVLEPDIVVKMNGKAIGRGCEDQHSADISFSGVGVTRCDKLEVFDDDVTGDEHMGSISLNLKDIPNGVAGDCIIKRVEGKDSSEQGWISYVVEYEVRY